MMKKYFILRARNFLIVTEPRHCTVEAIAMGLEVYDTWEWLLMNVQIDVCEWPLFCNKGVVPSGIEPTKWMFAGAPMGKVWVDYCSKYIQRDDFEDEVQTWFTECQVLYEEMHVTDTFGLENGGEICVHASAVSDEDWTHSCGYH